MKIEKNKKGQTFVKLHTNMEKFHFGLHFVKDMFEAAVKMIPVIDHICIAKKSRHTCFVSPS